jgi:YHS domain-containing protein
LWAHGVAFGGVISFIFADLVTLPLLFIYRRFYGTRAALRLFALLWFVMSAGGLVVDRLSHVASLVPRSHHVRFAGGNFALGWTLWLNVAAAMVLITLWLLARSTKSSGRVATDPICGMTVDTSAPGATRRLEHVDYYFCSPRCAERFDERHHHTAMDPV